MALASLGVASGVLWLKELEPETSVDIGSWAGGWGSRMGASLGVAVVEEAEVGSPKAVGYLEGGASVVVHSGHMAGPRTDCPQSLGLPDKQALLSYSLWALLLGLQISYSGPSH